MEIKKIQSIYYTCFALLILLPALSLAGEFKVIRVYDGDTIKAEGHHIEIKVRLAGIDAPETSRKKRDLGQSFSYQPKKFSADLVLNKTVGIKGYDLDGYNRVLWLVYLFGTNIYLEMVRPGLAEVSRGKPPPGFDLTPYSQADKQAKEAKRNMWSQGDKYIGPKEWRRMQREVR